MKMKTFYRRNKINHFGKANVGKSSLFNILMEEERVIVSEIPGTTRDVIKEKIYIEGVPILIKCIRDRCIPISREKYAGT